mgnify:CR=1 FL=1|jgi:hypothetical protein
MPNRTIYVRDEDQHIWHQAAELPGSVSETVAAALRQYLSRGTWREAIAMELGLAALDAAERAVEELQTEAAPQ